MLTATKRKPRPPLPNRERLVDEATRLVRVRGFHATSVNTVLKAAGISKGALYHYFPGKEDLGLAVLARAGDGFHAFLDATLDTTTPLASLERFFAAVLEKHRAAGFVGGCLWGNTALEMSDSDTACTAAVKRVFDAWIAKVEGVISAGQKNGQMRTDRSAAELAQLVVCTIEGGIMLARLRKQEAPLKNCLDSLRLLLMRG